LAATKQSPLLRIIGVPIASLFSRLQGSQLLNQPRRAEIHELICQTPGITIPDLADASGLSRNTILHHLRMMEKEHLIVSDSSGRSVHWFENGGRYGRERKAAYSVLQDERSRDVAKFIVANPGTSQCKVAGALGLAASVITWHLQRLERAELIHRQPSGRTMQCYPNQILPSLGI
jgi:predicted transcriptional regulator